MKVSQTKNSRWNTQQKSKLNEFLISEKIELLVNFYKNIIVGQLNFRRHTKFFQKMSNYVGRSSNQCKSKMQKYEKEAFLRVLKVPNQHYKFYLLLRKLKTLKRNSQNVIEIFKKKHNFKQKRAKIIEELCNDKIFFESNIKFYLNYFFINFK